MTACPECGRRSVKLIRKKIRKDSAYPAGRVANDLFCLAGLVGAVLCLVLYLHSDRTRSDVELASAIIIAIVWVLTQFLTWDITHSILDQGDVALLNSENAKILDAIERRSRPEQKQHPEPVSESRAREILLLKKNPPEKS